MEERKLDAGWNKVEEPKPIKLHPAKQKSGFAVLDKETMLAMASKGGKAAHAKGTAHSFNSETARAAALKLWEKRRAANRAAFPVSKYGSGSEE